MKSLIKKISGASVMALFLINSAFAQGPGFFEGESATGIAATRGGSLGQNITTVINSFLGLLGLAAVAFLIYAGILMVTAGGAEEQITKARKIIMYAVIGIVIILLSYTIVTFVTSALT